MYEAYGTLTDRDYVITQNGKGTNKTFSVVPMDKVKFKNTKVKPFSESKILSMLDKAYPDEDAVDYDEMSAKELYDLCVERDIDCKKKKDEDYYIKLLKKWDKEQEKDDDNDNDDDDNEKPDYNEMSAKELYKLCQERDIDCKPKKDEDYYIEKLEEWDKENSDDEKGNNDGWDDDDDDKPDYDEMSAKELYQLCQKRDIDVKPKKDEDYYIEKLKKWDKENSDEKDGKDDDNDDW
jgi:hypothetical protein